MKIPVLLILFLLVNECFSQVNSVSKDKYIDQNLPGLTPVIFASGFISTPEFDEYGCTFSPDYKEFYFTRTLKNPRRHVIYCSKYDLDKWSEPSLFVFMDEHQAGESVISADGEVLLFGKLVNDTVANTLRSEIWYSDKVNNSWSEPDFLFNGMYASISKEKTIYFTNLSLGFDKARIASANFKNDSLRTAVILPEPLNSEHKDAHPFIDPDEKYLLFDSNRPGGFGDSDIYICFKEDKEWSDPVNLGPEINTAFYDAIPYITPDGKYLFFCRGTDQVDIFWVDTKIIEKLKSD